MPNSQEPSKIRFRWGTRQDAISTDPVEGVALVPGQLLFAVYEDDGMSGATTNQKVVQGDIYLDLDESFGYGVRRINLANDVDTARSLQSKSARTTGSGGNWSVDADGITKLYDGLTIAIKLEGSYSTVYNTLNVSGLGDKLVWYTYGTRLTNQIPTNSEVFLTYRTDCGSYTLPQNASGSPGTLIYNAGGNNTYTDGWMISSVTRKMQTLTLLDPGDANNSYTYNGFQSVTASLGTIVTLKTWE